MKFIIIFFASLTVAVKALSVPKLLMEEWHMFKAQHGKTYENETEEQYRLQIYVDNLRHIEEHNKLFAEGKVSFELGMNQFGDWHLDEFKQKMLLGASRQGLYEASSSFCKKQAPYDSPMNLSESWNWVEKGAVTPARDQGQCSSCWAFSTVGALEGHHFIKTGQLVQLSEQNLMDCSQGRPYNNGHCTDSGGVPAAALKFVIDNKGIDLLNTYPYIENTTLSQKSKCTYDPANSGENITSCRLLPTEDEEQLKIAVEKEGPISVAILSGTCNFMLYKSGVYHEEECDYNSDVDHAVLVVGFGSDNGLDYWLVKNSWSTTWGEEGYVRMARNVGGNCGIASVAVFPVG